MMTEPTPGEVMRRLDDVAKRLEDVVREMREDRTRAEQIYVTQREWASAQQVIAVRIDGVAGDVVDLRADAETERRYRRQVLLALAVASLSAVVSVVIACMTLLLGR